MRDLAHGPRVLLRRLREIMAEPIEPQLRLDRIVQEIARNMVAEVCSFYVLRVDGVLELYATQGLNPQAVHLAQLKLGQGLVGTIAASARALNLTEAQKHPAFTYLPETGEEIYNAFLGVPILRAGRTLGVLVVQNQAKRAYADDEVEALETTAMVVGELIASGDLKRISAAGIDLDMRRPASFDGAPLSDGVGLGHVVLHEPRVVVTNLFAEDTETELARLRDAIGSLRLSIDDMLSRRDVATEGEHRSVLEAYRMFAHDQGWVRRLEEAVRNGLTAEAAVEKVQNDMRARMMHVTDPYLRERLNDFDDLANRLLRQLLGAEAGIAAHGLPRDAILVARTMGAAELLDYPREHLRGLVLEDGAATSHVVIVARAMGLPVVSSAQGVVAMAENGDAMIVDGEDGAVHLRPTADVEAAYAEKVRFRARRQEAWRALRDRPAQTRDGVPISLNINAGLMVDLPHLAETGADGIGLFRTELQFMIASTFPRVEAQERLYSSVLAAAAGKPVTFRTLDIGGDKVLPYFRAAKVEENPALGWRAIRLSLDKPGLLRTQMRALLRASAGAELRLMLPMITQVDEVRSARALLRKEVELAARFGHELPREIRIGAMLEVPALLYDLDALLNEVDFVSVGSNDLFQYFTATDRGNPAVASRFDPLSKPFLRALRTIQQGGTRAGKEVALCGELAGRPIAAMALMAIGYRSISMSAASIGPVKAMILAMELEPVRKAVCAVLDDHAPDETLRPMLRELAEAQGIVL